jgi:hypothetical protein
MSDWLPDGTGVLRDCEDGDDYQSGASYSVRFRRADVPGAIITQTAYPVNVGDGCKGPFLVRVETVWVVCRNPENPGGTEVWSASRAKDEDEAYETAEEAEVAAWNVANELGGDSGSHTWNRLPDPE